MQDVIFTLLVLVFSVILHEVAHGYMANWLGDPTARLARRLTLNPLSHIDPVGSVILPFILAITHSPMLIGYAKPVPYNPYNLQSKYGETLVAAAGPGTNILIALIFGLSARFFGAAMSQGMFEAFLVITYINIVLAVFNLIPIPPLANYMLKETTQLNTGATTGTEVFYYGDWNQGAEFNWGTLAFASSDSTETNFRKLRVTVRAVGAHDFGWFQPNAFVRNTALDTTTAWATS
jgi:hypothetical protein